MMQVNISQDINLKIDQMYGVVTILNVDTFNFNTWLNVIYDYLWFIIIIHDKIDICMFKKISKTFYLLSIQF